jgi:hypothetical protein
MRKAISLAKVSLDNRVKAALAVANQVKVKLAKDKTDNQARQAHRLYAAGQPVLHLQSWIKLKVVPEAAVAVHRSLVKRLAVDRRLKDKPQRGKRRNLVKPVKVRQARKVKHKVPLTLKRDLTAMRNPHQTRKLPLMLRLKPRPLRMRRMQMPLPKRLRTEKPLVRWSVSNAIRLNAMMRADGRVPLII